MDALKSKVTVLSDRISNFLKNVNRTGKEKRTSGFLNARAELLEKYWSQYQEVHDSLFHSSTDDQVSDEHFATSDQFYDVECAYTEALGWLKEQLAILHTTTSADAFFASVKSSPQSAPVTIKLPKINIPTFSGSYTDWPSFRDTYISLIHENDSLSDINKMHYLKSAISGEAAKLLKHLSVTSTNYTSAWDILTVRYENKRVLVNSNLNVLLSLSAMSSESPVEIRRVLDTFMQSVRALENLGRPVEYWTDWLVFLLANKLDPITRKDWETSISSSNVLPTFNSIKDFLERRLHTLDALKDGQTSERQTFPSPRRFKPTTRSHFSSSAKFCISCQGKHILLFCPQFKEKSVEQRLRFLQRHKLCSNCLRPNHHVQNCPSVNRCKHCGQAHHTMLHQPEVSTTYSPPLTGECEPARITKVHFSNSSYTKSSVLLATAIVRVQSPDGRTIRARALLDQGSESNFITTKLANMLQLSKKEVHIPVLGVGGCRAGIAQAFVNHHIMSINDANLRYPVQSLVLPTLTHLIPSHQLSRTTWPHIAGLHLADPEFHKPSCIDLILGADVYTRILLSEVRRGPPGTPVAQSTSLGWILSGLVSNVLPGSNSTLSLHASTDVNMLLRKFWELEESPTENHLTPEEKDCESFFKSSHQRDSNGRYIVRLPIKSSAPFLGKSRHFALSSLLRMERKFMKDSSLHASYSEFMDEYLSLQQMEIVRDETENFDRQYYLPHHAVFKPTSTTTKLRVVFNASQQSSNGISLNDQLLIGPKLQNDVFTIIMKWRIYPFVLSADIEKMYRQILVDRSDVDFQRILWRKTLSEPVKCFRLLTVTYGTACAPYLACRTLLQVADDHKTDFPRGAAIIREHFYVDDALFGAFNKEDALQSRNELNSLLQRGGFKLRKWLSNSQDLLNDIPEADREKVTSLKFVTDAQVKTLGIAWNPVSDKFTFQLKLPPVNHHTKRSILSDISRLYDPLGWVSPTTIIAKIFLQRLWLRKLDWDDELPSDLLATWISYRHELNHLNTIQIDRWVGTSNTESALELHGFCDASLAAYGAVVYLRIIHDLNTVQVSLIASKTRVSPVKTISLPRLELCAATLLADLLSYVQQNLNLPNVPVHAWSDSTIVLAWLKEHPSKWKVFVANRVSSIHDKLPTAVWHHVRSEDNPADCTTRGLVPTNLAAYDTWWSGPHWLSKHSTHWPTPLHVSTPEAFEEEVQRPLTFVVREPEPELNLVQRYSTLTKLINVTAYCLRFYFNAKSEAEQRITGLLSPEERNAALTKWIKLTQYSSFESELQSLTSTNNVPSNSKLRALNPFLDENGVIRVGGRLKHSLLTYNEKFPIILPKNDCFTHLIIDHSHTATLHGGPQLTLHHTRNKYWILSGRSKVKQFVQHCVICYRYKAKTMNQLMSDLPLDRIRPSKPFLNSGIDYAGPINVKPLKGRGQKVVKSYIAVFICLVTRAIHLELVMDLTSESFLAAFKRFVSRRGHCARLYSDNATNFIAADKQLTQYIRQMRHEPRLVQSLLTHNTIWHFIPPASPHFGGIWEAGVKSMKYHLRRVVGDHLLSIEEIQTVLAQVEACLNSRPLHPLSDDPEDLHALTPGHFLVGEAILTIPEPSLLDIPTNRLNRWQLVQQMVEHLWRRWYKEYIQHLQLRNKWQQKKEAIKVNDLVLIKEDRLPPAKWLLGRVSDVHPGTDGIVRVVTVKHQDGHMKRPITKICVLPVKAHHN